MGQIWKKFKIFYRASVKSRNKNDVNVWTAKPKSSSFQKINKIYISQKVKSVYQERENKILYFEFKNKKFIDFEISIEAELSKEKFILKTSNNIKNNQLKKFSRYLKNEKFLEQTTNIKRLTKQTTRKQESILDKIIAINKFLKKNFKYTTLVKKRGVKNLNLKNLKGDCGEVGALFVAMCRILKIPAINKTGYIIYHDEVKNIYEHGWTSVYLNNIGWIDIDPLAENIKKVKNRYIYEQKNYFLNFLNGFNIEIKPPIPKNHKTDYWKKLGLPLTKKSAQIFQPLIFSSKDKLNFKEYIKLIK